MASGEARLVSNLMTGSPTSARAVLVVEGDPEVGVITVAQLPPVLAVVCEVRLEDVSSRSLRTNSVSSGTSFRNLLIS